jgi:hypothetical protein
MAVPPWSEKDAKLAQKLGQLQPFIAVFPQEFMGQLRIGIFWANLTPETPFSPGPLGGGPRPQVAQAAARALGRLARAGLPRAL